MAESAVLLDPNRTAPAPAAPAPGVPMIHTALSRVMAQMHAVGKSGQNHDQGYKFRPVDDMMNGAHRALVSQGVTIVPQVLQRIPEKRQTHNNRVMHVMHLEVRYRLTAPDGSYVDGITWGEGADSADKATNKAMAMALKYFLLQTLMIPTVDMVEGDADHPEATGPAPVPEVDQEFLAEARRRIDAVTTPGALRGIWHTVREAKNARRITPDDADALGVRMKARSAELAAEARPEDEPANPAPDPGPEATPEPATPAPVSSAAPPEEPPGWDAAPLVDHQDRAPEPAPPAETTADRIAALQARADRIAAQNARKDTPTDD